MKEDLPSFDIHNASVGIKLVEDISTHSADICINAKKKATELVVKCEDKSNEKLCVIYDTNKDPGDGAEDDIDMDVEMEVEEPMPSCLTVVEQAARGSSPQNLPRVSEIEPSIPQRFDEGWIPPPPSDEEMIPPPPPPENENFPPPPPDDPPEPNVLPPYSDPYNAYAGYTYGYYDQSVAGGSAYGAPQGGAYYEALDSYVTNAPVIADSVGPLLYYDPNEIQVQAPPVLNGASSGMYNVSIFENPNTVNETGSSCSENKVSNGVQNIEKGFRDSSFVIPTIQAQATVSKTADVGLLATGSASVINTTFSQGHSKGEEFMVFITI